jgi:polar amino acid transport system substrate-binding protein
VTSLADAPALFAAIESERIDAVVQDFPINAYRATKDDAVVVNEEIKTDEVYGMAVRKGDSATLKLLNDGLKKAKSDGTYDTLFEKYFGKKP